jgi:predicted DNA-binding protein (MmcQ/YjbR family)
MVTTETVRQIALSFAKVTEQLHFEKASFRVNKKIFATIDVKNNQVCIKLSVIDQSVFCAFDKTIIFPVPNKWGKQGWTFINLKKVRKGMLVGALQTAYCQVAPKKLLATKR